MAQTVKLLSLWASGFALKAQLALRAKGIPFQYLEEDLSNKSELLLASNPLYKKVPVLIHNGRPICDSRFIVEYIDETWPTSPLLLPEDPYDRYLVRFWSDYRDRKFEEVRVQIVSMKFKSGEERNIVREKVQDNYSEMFITMESGVEEMERRGLLYDGESPKYMDVCFAPSVAFFEPMEKLLGFGAIDAQKCPWLSRWVEKLSTNEVVKSTMPDGDRLTEYCRKRWGLE